MKYEIDTIPVWDAVKADTECPICLLESRSRQSAVRYFLGPSVMVPEVRVTVNKKGFSPENLRLLSKDPNKLGLALLHHTRIKTLREEMDKPLQALRKEAQRHQDRGTVRKLVGNKSLTENTAALALWLEEQERTCLIEDKVRSDVERYLFTLLHLWQQDNEFRSVWKTSKATCLHHAPGLLKAAVEHLSTFHQAAFLEEFVVLLDQNLARIEEDILAFTQTFDATKSRVLVGRPEGALDRCLQKLAGAFPEYEEAQKSRRGPLMGTIEST